MRLLELYLADTDFAGGDLAALVDATEGVTASFVKELVRRAVLVAALERGQQSDTSPPVGTAHLETALDDLLHHSAPILRSSLGANPHIAAEVGDTQAQAGGWFAYAPNTGHTFPG